MLNICLVGAGRAGMIHAENFAHRVRGARISAIVDPDASAREAAVAQLSMDAGFETLEAALDGASIDAVVIVAPTAMHKELAVLAAKAGKHIFSEKPMAMTEAECDEMIIAAREAGVILQMGFMRRFDEGLIRAKEMLEADEIGTVVLVKSHTRGPSSPRPWMYDISISNGPLAEVNSHDIDTVRWLTGCEFQSVYAIAGNYRCPDAREKFPDFYDNVLLTGRLASGAQVSIDGAQGVKYGYDARVEIVGTRGVIRAGRSADCAVTVADVSGHTREPFVTSWRKLYADAYLAEDEHFAQCAEAGRAPGVSGRDGKMAVRVVNAGNLSIREGRVVELEAK